MNDLHLMGDVMPADPLPDLDQLAASRSRLDRAMRAQQVPARAVRPSRSRRWLALAGGAAAVAAGVTAVIVVAGTPDPAPGPAPVSDPQAVQVLHLAALTVQRDPDRAPRPDQFVYQQYMDGSQSWLSADGTRDGLRTGLGGNGRAVFPGCRDGIRQVLRGDQVIGSEACTPDPAYLSDLPTTTKQMLAYLTGSSTGGTGQPQVSGKAIWGILEGHYLRPASRSALFNALAEIPGFRARSAVTDPGGRPAVEIVWLSETSGGIGLYFDPQNFTYLGMRTGTTGSALQRTAIVDQAGQQP